MGNWGTLNDGNGGKVPHMAWSNKWLCIYRVTCLLVVTSSLARSLALPCIFHFEHGRALRWAWRSYPFTQQSYWTPKLRPDYKGSFQLLTPPFPARDIPQRCCCPSCQWWQSVCRPDSPIQTEAISLIPSYRATRPRYPLQSEDGASLV